MLRAYPVQFAVVLGLLAGACSEDMASPTHVVNLRVLAIRAAPPEVRAPEGQDLASTFVDALVVGVKGEVCYTWTLCFVPGPVVDGRLCLDSSLEMLLDSGLSATSVTIPVPSQEKLLALAPPELEGLKIDLTSGVSVQIQLDVTDLVDGTAACPVHDREDDPGASGVMEPDRRAFKRIVISDREVTNTNPVLDGITWNGEPWGEEQIVEIVDTDVGGKMVPRWTESTRETYDDGGAPATESLLFSWFIDDEASDLTKERSDDAVSANIFKPGRLDEETEQSGRLVTLWLVARDERGGVTWLTRQLRIIQGE